MKKRIISVVIALLIFAPMLLLGGIAFNLTVVALGILGLKEMLDIRDSKYPLPAPMKLITFGSFIYLVINIATGNDFIYLLDYRNIALVMFLLLIPIIIYHDNRVYSINDALFLVGTVFFLGISFNLIINLRQQSLMYVIYLLVITTMTDTYALIGGSLVGKHKLIESISPKKTWEGLIIGTFFGVLISCVFYYVAINDSINITYLILGTTLLSLIGQLGDLVFSSIKRLYNKKDFSSIMPGHGGILDRLDSFIFVSLGYVLLMFML
ncbi:MAG: phosphatidate cytidylyltransferase [Bacilli bacterium]